MLDSNTLQEDSNKIESLPRDIFTKIEIIKNEEKWKLIENLLSKKEELIPHFRKDTINHPAVAEGGRTIEDYEKMLMFTREEVRGKKVLDLGCGHKVRLAKSLKEEGITDQVISLSPDFIEEKYVESAKKSFPEAKLVAGVAQNLPFPDESFDNIFALHVFQYLSLKQLTDMISEVARTLKAGGKAIIGPAWNKHYMQDNEREHVVESITQHLNKKLKTMGVEISKEIVVPNESQRFSFDGSRATTIWEPHFNIIITKKEPENKKKRFRFF